MAKHYGSCTRMTWISVEKQLPPEYEFVLVYAPGDNITLGRWSIYEETYVENWKVIKVNKIEWHYLEPFSRNDPTHWMPLPENPQE